MEMARSTVPSSLDLTDRNLADSFKKWKRQLQVYMEASGNSNKQSSDKRPLYYTVHARKSLRFMIILNLKEKMTTMILLRCSKN
jgi:hypothetical protein